MNILLLATRDPQGRTTGRKVVLRTIISSLKSIGHKVTVAVFHKHKVKICSGNEHIDLPLPGRCRIIWNVLYHFTKRNLSLNECLYFSPGIFKELRKLCNQNSFDIVIADMIRTAPYADSLGKPWILDLDDLLSRRYRDTIEQKLSTEMLFGYFSDRLPSIFKTLFTRFAKILLARESLILAERELFFASRADAVSLVSNDEAQELSSKLEKHVFWTPMSVEIRDAHASGILKRPLSLVFMGGLDYQPNLEAVRFYLYKIVPALIHAGMTDTVLTVIGYCPPFLREKLSSKHLNLLGYVEDISLELIKHQLFLAPIISGTGIKTKVLEAMAFGLPVLASPQGVKGLNVTSDKECYIAHSPEEYVQLLKYIEANPEEVAKTADTGRSFVKAFFSSEVLAEKWAAILKSILKINS